MRENSLIDNFYIEIPLNNINLYFNLISIKYDLVEEKLHKVYRNSIFHTNTNKLYLYVIMNSVMRGHNKYWENDIYFAISSYGPLPNDDTYILENINKELRELKLKRILEE